MDTLWRYGGYFLIDQTEAVGCGGTCTNIFLVRHIGQSEHDHVHAAHDPLPGQYRRHVSSAKRSDL